MKQYFFIQLLITIINGLKLNNQIIGDSSNQSIINSFNSNITSTKLNSNISNINAYLKYNEAQRIELKKLLFQQSNKQYANNIDDQQQVQDFDFRKILKEVEQAIEPQQEQSQENIIPQESISLHCKLFEEKYVKSFEENWLSLQLERDFFLEYAYDHFNQKTIKFIDLGDQKVQKTFSAFVKPHENCKKGVVSASFLYQDFENSSGFGILFKYQDQENFLMLELLPGVKEIQIRRKLKSNWQQIIQIRQENGNTFESKKYINVKLFFDEERINVVINGMNSATFKEDQLKHGTYGFFIENMKSLYIKHAKLDQFRLYDLQQIDDYYLRPQLQFWNNYCQSEINNECHTKECRQKDCNECCQKNVEDPIDCQEQCKTIIRNQIKL